MRETKFKKTDIGEIPVNWDVSCLKNTCEINPAVSGRKPEEFFYIDLESVEDGVLLKRQLVQRVNAPSRAQRQIKTFDILYQTVRPYQRNNLYVDFECSKYIASTGYAVLRSKEGVSNSRFLYYVLLTDKFVKQVLDRCTGTSYPAINPSSLSEVQFALPTTLAEQERIAEALSDVDGLLRELDGVIAKKRAIKQGAMQELLTGKRRLEGFEGEWKSHPFRDFYKYAAEGGTPNTSIKAYYENGKVPFVKIEDTTRKYIYESKSFITEEGLRHASAWLVPENSIIFTNGATIGNVSINKIPVSTKQGILGIIPSDIIDLEFMYYLLSNSIFQKEVEARETKGTFATIILPRLNEIVSFIPKDKAEQSAIATILSEMDADIEALEAKRAKYEQLKQGMMQELLTGKIRLV